jgi:hypothetical protein
VLPPALIKAAGDLAPFEQFDHAVDGVAFRDASEIELHARFVERDRTRRRIERHMSPPTWRRAPASSSSDGRRPSPRRTPRLHQRADRDVERAAGLALIAHRVRDEVEQLPAEPRRDAAPPPD